MKTVYLRLEPAKGRHEYELCSGVNVSKAVARGIRNNYKQRLRAYPQVPRRLLRQSSIGYYMDLA